MARIRSINPSAPMDEDVASMTIWARHVWAYLPCHADREGRLKDSAFTLKLAILPSDDVDMDAVLAELTAKRHIIRYEVDGRRFIQIRSFKKHQSPHVRETESQIPGVPRDATAKVVPSTGPAPGTHGTSTPIPDPDQVRSDPGQCLPAFEADSDDRQPSPLPLGDPNVPRTGFELRRLHERLRTGRWQMPPSKGVWDEKLSDTFMRDLSPGVEREIRPALDRYFADETKRYVEQKHNLDLFCRNFDAFRVVSAAPTPDKPSRLLTPIPMPPPNARQVAREAEAAEQAKL